MAESSTGCRLAGSAIGKKGECEFVIGLYNIRQPIDQCIFCNVEARVAERLAPQTPGLGVWASIHARRVVSLDKEIDSTLPLFTQVY